MAKLSLMDVRRIRHQRTDGVSTARLAMEYGVSIKTIEDVVYGRTWVKVGRRVRRRSS